jgi:signal transduction histidine kinase
MRLLQVSLRNSLIFSLAVVIISIPISMFTIRALFSREVDESLFQHTDQFLKHLKRYDYLEDLETDLAVLDELSYDVDIKPTTRGTVVNRFSTISIYDSVEHAKKPFRELATSVDIRNKHYLLTVRMALVGNSELVMAIGLMQAVLIIMLAGGLILLNRSMSKRLWRPFYSMLDQLKAYKVDRNESIVPQPTPISEFNDLNETVATLTARSRKAYLDQKEFIENASHELQTPIAIFQSKLDMLMQAPHLSDTDAATISELEATAARMARLNKNLLLISKIDNQQFATRENVPIHEIVKTVLAQIDAIGVTENIVITTDIKPYSLSANRTLIEILVSNLLSNAVRHNIPGGHVNVDLHAGVLKISNSGDPNPRVPERMFARFVKDSATGESTGLGLAIVKNICDANGYTLTYTFAMYHIFTVQFNRD